MQHRNDYVVTATIRFMVPADSKAEAVQELHAVFDGIPIVESCEVTDVQQI